MRHQSFVVSSVLSRILIGGFHALAGIGLGTSLIFESGDDVCRPRSFCPRLIALPSPSCLKTLDLVSSAGGALH
jgi:hypothetical protein